MTPENIAQQVRENGKLTSYGDYFESWGDDICSVKCDPSRNFSRWSLQYFQIPEPMKPFVKSIQQLTRINHHKERFFFHYEINKERVAKINESRYYVPATGDIFNDEFGPASCIYTNFGHETEIIGKKELIQAVMNCLKSGPEQARELLARLVRRDLEKAESTSLYDMVTEPREVQY